MAKLIDIEGIGAFQAQKLAAIGLTTQDELLAAAAAPSGRQSIVDRTGASMKQVLDWANRADLARIDGVGDQYADLLEEAGVDTVPELAQRNAQNLHAKLVEINEVKVLVNRVPGASEIAKWVSEAKALPRILQY